MTLWPWPLTFWPCRLSPPSTACSLIRNHVWVHWFDWCEGLLDLLNVKRRPSEQIVWLTRSCACANFHIGGNVSFSARTRTWTRLVVDAVRGNMSVEPKHRKLWDKLYTYTSSHEKICMRTRPCKSKSCGSRDKTSEIRWQVTYRHVLLCENLHTHTTS